MTTSKYPHRSHARAMRQMAETKETLGMTARRLREIVECMEEQREILRTSMLSNYEKGSSATLVSGETVTVRDVTVSEVGSVKFIVQRENLYLGSVALEEIVDDEGGHT